MLPPARPGENVLPRLGAKRGELGAGLEKAEPAPRSPPSNRRGALDELGREKLGDE